MSTKEKLQQETQAVLDVIENPEVVQVMRHDKNQLPRALDRQRVDHVRILGKARVLHPHQKMGRRARGTQHTPRGHRRPRGVRPAPRDVLARRVPPVALLAHVAHPLSLWVYFNYPQGRTLLLDTFLAPSYLNTIQSACPWILRYLAVAAALSRKAQPPSVTRLLAETVRNVCRGVVRDTVYTANRNLADLKLKGDPPVDELVSPPSIVHSRGA
ncbi:hypothetical protein OF83DRAFT_22964 [Amylostereum chailletii]|nr:hypothetical protein OF83DRAFT_22964 [Amylostereum chailletii]